MLIGPRLFAQQPRPTKEQLQWQDAEIGVVFHYDLHVFDGQKYKQGNNRVEPVLDYNMFNPEQLDTDQWVKAAKAAGAKFAILTVTHETGFALYQSDINPYCMKALKFQDGRGDVLRDFVNSCRKYGLLPGIYLGIRWNAFFGVHDFKVEGDSQFAKNRQLAYKKLCEGMVKELCTRYGDIFMFWFDGGADDPTNNGADVLPIVQKYQPKCLFYHNAQRADFRWGGSESGTVPYPCWATFPFPFSHSKNQDLIFADNFNLLKHGDKQGKYWMPAMSDAPLRGSNGRHEWFWEPEDEAAIEPLEDLMHMYKNSVGHNSTLILGLTPDDRGLMPQADVQRLKEWGEKINEEFGHPLASRAGAGNVLEIELNRKTQIDHLSIMEDIAKGERVRKFKIEAKVDGHWKVLLEGESIGHKFMGYFEPVQTKNIRLEVLDSVNQPIIKAFNVY